MTAALDCGADRPAGGWDLPQRAGWGPTIARRYGAVAMQLVACLDIRQVELHILTDHGESIVVACPGDSIFAVQQHIAQISRQCPEIAGWTRTIALSADRG